MNLIFPIQVDIIQSVRSCPNSKGVWYLLGRDGESGFNALSIVTSDFDKDESKSKGEFIEETRNRAIAYISQYRKTNGEDFYYSVVYDKI
jgi:hypothetical protein